MNRREFIHSVCVASAAMAVPISSTLGNQPEAMPTVKEISVVGKSKSGETHFGKGRMFWENGKHSFGTGEIVKSHSIEFEVVDVPNADDTWVRREQNGRWRATVTTMPSYRVPKLIKALGESGTLWLEYEHNPKIVAWKSKKDGAMFVGMLEGKDEVIFTFVNRE